MQSGGQVICQPRSF